MMLFRHGDVVLEKIEPPPRGKKVARHARGVVLAEGEATGHAHVIQSRDVQLYESPENDNGVRLLRVKRPAVLRHEEHGPITLPEGWYRVRIKRQYSPDGWTQVTD